MENFDALQKLLGELLEGGAAEYHDTLTSTQARAKELAFEGALRALVVAGEQTAGRGRSACGCSARHWESPRGSGIYFSVMFHTELPAESLHLVNIAAALSVADAVRGLLGIELELKWPNDLLISRADGQRKVCGILSESALRGGPACCVTGIGLNLYEPAVLPPDLKGRAGWLRGGRQKNDEIDLVKLLGLTVENFFRWIDRMEREGVGSMLQTYRERCASIGRTVMVETGAEVFIGLCSGIGGHGELIVETPEGVRSFHAADVTHARLESRENGNAR